MHAAGQHTAIYTFAQFLFIYFHMDYSYKGQEGNPSFEILTFAKDKDPKKAFVLTLKIWNKKISTSFLYYLVS